MIYVNYCADKAAVFLWSAYAPRYKTHSVCLTIIRCIHSVAMAVFGLCTIGIPHILAYCWVAHRIETTDLAHSPLRNPSFLSVAMLLHQEACEDFARQRHAQPLSRADHAVLMRIEPPRNSRYHLTQLTNSFLDQTDTRSSFEKYKAYVREHAPYYEEEIDFEEALQRFAQTLLPSLMPHLYLEHSHPLFQRNPHGYNLSFERSRPSEDTLELCKELGTVLGAWVSDAKLAKYPLGRLLSSDFYQALLWFLVDLSPAELNLSNAQLILKGLYTPFNLAKCAPIHEVAKAFKAIYRGGIEQLMRGDLQSEYLLMTLVQGNVCGPENAIKLVEAAERREGLPSDLQEKCRALKSAFQSDPSTIRSFLVALNEIELEALQENREQEEAAAQPYGRLTSLIQAIEKYAALLPAPPEPVVPELPIAPPAPVPILPEAPPLPTPAPPPV